MSQLVDVAIVGAGPAGTTLAAALASRGIEVLVLERAPAWRWRAGGVFTSPAAVWALERAGLEHEVLDSIARPIPAMRATLILPLVVLALAVIGALLVRRRPDPQEAEADSPTET